MKMLSRLKGTIRSAIGIRNDTDFYSQGGEDAIVWNTFYHALGIARGKYIDVGAFHPFRHSNTYLLYRAGWSGVNIDPRPGSKALFDRYRKRDLNIEAGVGDTDGTLTYYMVGTDSTMNTFSRENLDRLGLLESVQKEIDVPVYSLKSLMERFNVSGEIDYLNIDAEGFELEILHGNNFSQCRPRVISIEQNGVRTLSDAIDSETCSFLKQKGYVPYAKNLILSSVSTVFYLNLNLLK